MDRSWMSIKNYLDPKYLDGTENKGGRFTEEIVYS